MSEDSKLSPEPPPMVEVSSSRPKDEKKRFQHLSRRIPNSTDFPNYNIVSTNLSPREGCHPATLPAAHLTCHSNKNHLTLNDVRYEQNTYLYSKSYSVTVILFKTAMHFLNLLTIIFPRYVRHLTFLFAQCFHTIRNILLHLRNIFTRALSTKGKSLKLTIESYRRIIETGFSLFLTQGILAFHSPRTFHEGKYISIRKLYRSNSANTNGRREGVASFWNPLQSGSSNIRALTPAVLISITLLTSMAAATPDKNGIGGVDKSFRPQLGGVLGVMDAPVFVLPPEDAYIIKNKPIALTCRAVQAAKVRFKCNGGTPTDSTERYIDDPTTGTRQVEAQVTVTREQVEEYFAHEGFSCFCTAWNSRGAKAVSGSATVAVAYLRRHFFEPPYSRSVPIESQVEMRCLPPEGSPAPRTYWLKNDRPIDLEVEKNYRISSEGSLLLLSAGPEDMANFTCVAENVAAKRIADPAFLRVFVDGTWSTWSPWSPCSSQCGKGIQKRTRTCTAPENTNEAACRDLSEEQRECTSVPCPVIDGVWSPWSDWTTCGSDCVQHSTRVCNAPAPQYGGRQCIGEEFVSRNCTGGLCKGGVHRYGGEATKQARDEAIRQDITLIVVLSILVPLVILLLFFVYKKYNRKNRQNGVLYEAAASDYPMPFYSNDNQEKKLNAFGPDLTQGINSTLNSLSGGRIIDHTPYTAPVSISSNDHNNTKSQRGYDVHYSTPGSGEHQSESTASPSEHLYDLPLIRSSLDSPSPTEGLHLLPSTAGAAGCASLDRPHFHLGQAVGGGSLARAKMALDAPGSPELASLEKPDRSASPLSFVSDATSGYSNPSNPSDAGGDPSDFMGVGGRDDTVVWEMVGHSGSRLVVPEYGVTLTIPMGSIAPDTNHKLYVGVILRTNICMSLNERQTLLSPVICCGPPTVKLLKPAILSFEHSASLQHAAWRLHVLSCRGSPALGDQPWEKLLTLGEERLDTPIYTQLDGNQAYLMTENLQQFALAGESAASNSAVKQLRLVVSAPPPALDGRLFITAHVTQDTSAHIKCVTVHEKRRGASLLDKPKLINLQDSGENLVLTLDEVAAGWKISQGCHYHQEIPFEAIWTAADIGGSQWSTVSFILERSESSPCSTLGGRAPTLSCRLVACQKGCSNSRQVTRINSDFPYAPVTDSPAHMLFRPSTVSSTGSAPLVSLTPDQKELHIPLRQRKELCRCLDPPNARGNDWRMLAAQLNVDRYLNYFACKNSPTEHILDLWEARHREPSAITDLLNVLRVMGRPDAAHVLESHAGAWI